MTDYSDPWWGHISGKCIDDCPWCHINELQAELAAMREAANYTVNAWAAGNMEGTDDGIEALAALLQESSDE